MTLGFEIFHNKCFWWPCRNLQDPNAPVSTQGTSIKLLHSVVEVMFARHADRTTADSYRLQLGRILDVFVSKLSFMKSQIPKLLAAGQCLPKLMSPCPNDVPHLGLSIFVACAKPEPAWQQSHCSFSLAKPPFAVSLQSIAQQIHGCQKVFNCQSACIVAAHCTVMKPVPCCFVLVCCCVKSMPS